ncbi:uncharacterized protein LACBIDRAFT_320596 [Laccaria bicolor S238N-H82]|uniref:Predicted protein n=1 Tax=Laccaria bicolor (strain S238N-H82 / ATCC MYA-4686) TaxID=486041 RepID=B0CQJ3_LACBS|nr:uncharacterized protein LACBIDRAFT_320596 [Laccaria bicolor S238N-H82]EDR15654.1 predicted protein [Laccaria bicolor S238N-H82]|eukprot:XP_001873862.1 predicted protein [Laccaria bicolor S238N-H82]
MLLVFCSLQDSEEEILAKQLISEALTLTESHSLASGVRHLMVDKTFLERLDGALSRMAGLTINRKRPFVLAGDIGKCMFISARCASDSCGEFFRLYCLLYPSELTLECFGVCTWGRANGTSKLVFHLRGSSANTHQPVNFESSLSNAYTAYTTMLKKALEGVGPPLLTRSCLNSGEDYGFCTVT